MRSLNERAYKHLKGNIMRKCAFYGFQNTFHQAAIVFRKQQRLNGDQFVRLKQTNAFYVEKNASGKLALKFE